MWPQLTRSKCVTELPLTTSGAQTEHGPWLLFCSVYIVSLQFEWTVFGPDMHCPPGVHFWVGNPQLWLSPRDKTLPALPQLSWAPAGVPRELYCVHRCLPDGAMTSAGSAPSYPALSRIRSALSKSRSRPASWRTECFLWENVSKSPRTCFKQPFGTRVSGNWKYTNYTI